MSIFEKQATLGRELFELNSGTLRRLVELQAKGVREYFETNRAFAERLPEAKDITSFMALQREYGEAVWQGFTEGIRSNGEVVKEAVENARELLRNSFGVDEAQAGKPAPATTAKSSKASAEMAPAA